MATTGWKSPTSTGVSHNQWSTPTNAYADGGGVAWHDIDEQMQDYYGFSFGLSGGATVLGITIRLDAACEDDFWDPKIDEINLSWDGGSTWTTYNGTTPILSTGYQDYDIGGSSEDWGHTWDVDADEMDGTNFVVRFGYEAVISSDEIYLDHIEVNVDFLPGDKNINVSESIIVTENKLLTTSAPSLAVSDNVVVTENVVMNVQGPDLKVDLGNIRGIRIV